jgi:dephospho-CoA kinase
VNSQTVRLTGGLASGKSTVARWLRQAGHTVIDADRLVGDLYRPGEPGALAVHQIFGDSALDADGSVDRSWLANRVFHDTAGRERLEAAIHPLVGERFRRTAAATDGVVVLEATLLIEAGLAEAFDLVVAVEADVDSRIARAVDRGMRREDARARVAAQAEDASRRPAADVVLYNNADLEALRDQVDELLGEIEQRTVATRVGRGDDA